ncbi:MAG: hypothetical protein ACKVPX_00260 [Myxococcaceae bacterium]
MKCLGAAVCVAVLTACGGPVATIALVPRNESGQVGTATLFDKGRDVEIVVETIGGSDKGRQLAHIRTGPCADNGSVAGFVLENLVPLENGQSTTLIEDRTVLDLQGARYNLTIQNSGDPSRATACGVIP